MQFPTPPSLALPGRVLRRLVLPLPAPLPMSDHAVENLLARLAGRGAATDSGADADPYRAIAATEPDQSAAKAAAAEAIEQQRREKLDQLLGRIAHLTGGATIPAVASTGVGATAGAQRR